MATDRELSFPIEDFMGVDQQVDRENIDNYHQWETQNLWEKKINMLETRGGSAVFANGWPSNVNGIDNIVRIFKNTLDHKRVVAVQAQENGGTPISPPLGSMPSGVALSWVSGGAWNSNITGNSDIYYQPVGIILRFCGYGYDNYYLISDATTISGFSAGAGQKLQVVVSSSPVINANITCIEVYAVVGCGGATAKANQSTIWAGSIDLSASATGTFTFANAPVSKRSTSGAGSVGQVPSQFMLIGATSAGGALVAGKTYYVTVMPQALAWSATQADCENSWRFYGNFSNVGLSNAAVAITLLPGQNSIVVTYPPSSFSPAPPTFNAMLIALGEDPHLMAPYGITNVNINSTPYVTGMGQNIATILSYPQNTPAVVDIAYFGQDSCNLMFRQSDFSTGDMLCRINNDGSKTPIFISRQSLVNRYDNSQAANASVTIDVTASSSSGNILFTVSPTNFGQPIPANTPFVLGGGTAPGGMTLADSYYLLPQGNNTYYVATTPNGTPIAYSSAGASVTMAINNFNSYPNIASGGFLYTGQYALSQPLLGQSFAFQYYQNLAFFVTGQSNNAALVGPGGYPNTPASGTNYYVTDGTVAALVVFDWSENPTPIPAGNIIGLYQESILISSNNYSDQFSGYPDAVTFSLPTNPSSFEVQGEPGLNQFFSVEGGGEAVNGFGTFPYQFVYVSPQQFLACIKKNSTWILENLPTANLNSNNQFSSWPTTFMTQISKSVGTPQGRTIVYTPIGIIFAAVDNVYLVKGGTEPVPIGDPISFILKAADLSKASAVYHDEQYKLSLYSSTWSGASGYNNVEFWLDIKKMRQAQGKPDWKGPMLGRAIDYDEVENLTGDGTVYNLTRDRVCVDRQNIQVFKTDIIPAETDTVIYDFSNPVTTILETKYYRVQEKDNNMDKIFTRTYYKTRVNAAAGSPLQLNEVTLIDGQQVDSQTINMNGLASVNFDDQPQLVYPVFPSPAPTLPYVGRTIAKNLTTSGRIAYGGIELFYRVIRRRI